MGKNVTKKRQARRLRRRRALRSAALVAVLALAGVGVLAGMAMFNKSAGSRGGGQWVVRGQDMEVAAPPMGRGYAADGGVVAGDAAAGDLALGFVTALPTAVPTPAPAPTPTPTARPTAEPVTLTISAAGDCTFGGQVGAVGRNRFLRLAKQYGYGYFFENVRPIFEADDLTIVNLEGPLTRRSESHKKGFVFKADPQCVQILTGAGVELCNLANNHSRDYGARGLSDTTEALDEAGIGYCGYDMVYDGVIKGVRVRALGFTRWSHSKSSVARAVAAAREGCDLLIVNMHWGEEGHRRQNASQTAMGRAAIDAGADLVIGTHPHVYQGIEKYKGRYIVYSLGNFCFAGASNPRDKRCLIFQQTFSFIPGLGHAGIEDMGINIIPATFSSVPDTNDLKPTVMAAAEGAELLKAVAAASVNLTLADTRWSEGNYMAANGLIAPEGAVAAEDAPVPAT